MNESILSPKEDGQYAFSRTCDEIIRLISAGSCGPAYPPHASDDFALRYLAYNLDRKRETTSYSERPRSDLQSRARTAAAKVLESVRDERSLSGFLAREEVNRKINEKGIVLNKDLTTTSDFRRARRIIRDILGSTPNIQRIQNSSCFGNGASCTLRRADADRTFKWVHKLSTTRSTFELMRHYMSTSPIWSGVPDDTIIYLDRTGKTVYPDSGVTFVSYSVYDTVPKDVNINRIILKEPELNGFLQKGIGKEVRRLLKKYGINLNQSGVRNSILAKEGSIHNHLATIDAERASDSLTLALYEALLPRKWYELLLVARTPQILLPDGTIHDVAMMSGMGNGFTFEMESVIFYALGRAAAYHSSLPFAEEFVSIHGDDLIVPADCSSYVFDLYEVCGVVVNKAKSFTDGPFRESCGGHWYNGNDVKPFYVKRESGKTLGDWFWLYNSLLLWLNNRERRIPELCDLLTEIARYCVRFYERVVELNGGVALPRKGAITALKVPPTFSRRAGLFSEPTKMFNRSCWKQLVTSFLPSKACTNMYGAYMQSLHTGRTTSVYDIIMGRRPQDDEPWEVDVDGIDVTSWSRLTRWESFADVNLPTPLWLASHLKRTRVS